MTSVCSVDKARKILVDILKFIALPENSRRLSEAKSSSGYEMIKMMQLVFPIVMELQMSVLSNHGFIGREGLVHFEQIVREMEAEDVEIGRLRDQIRSTYLPLISSSSSPDVLI